MKLMQKIFQARIKKNVMYCRSCNWCYSINKWNYNKIKKELHIYEEYIKFINQKNKNVTINKR